MTSTASNGSEQATAILPKLDHFNYTDFDQFYEPAEDTFLLCDALLADLKHLDASNAGTEAGVTGGSGTAIQCLEVGSGSGCVICYLGTLLRDVYGRTDFHLMATDINVNAVIATRRTAAANELTVDVRQTDFVDGTELAGLGSLDVLLFNPPYVPTDDDEVTGAGCEVRDMITAAWAGGTDGRVVIDRFLPLIQGLLRRPTGRARDVGGRCYMVLVQENRPSQLIAHMRDTYDLDCTIVLSRRAKNELLHIVRMQHALGAR